MRRAFVLGLLLVLVALAGLVSRYNQSAQQEPVFELANKTPELAPMCPWRNPEGDLPRLFPEATRFEREIRVLSGARIELAQRLGRMPTADENALQVYRTFRAGEPAGELVTRRVKGSFGAIELVIAADEKRQFKSLIIQRLREPPAASKALLATDWGQWLGGKGAESSWDCENLEASLPAEAHASANAIVEGARSSMILLAVSSEQPRAELVQSHKH